MTAVVCVIIETSLVVLSFYLRDYWVVLICELFLMNICLSIDPVRWGLVGTDTASARSHLR